MIALIYTNKGILCNLTVRDRCCHKVPALDVWMFTFKIPAPEHAHQDIPDALLEFASTFLFGALKQLQVHFKSLY